MRRKKKVRQEVVGSCTVAHADGKMHEVIITQDITDHYRGTSAHGKRLFLDSLEGERVFVTGRAGIFTLADGTELRQKGTAKVGG